MNQKTHRQSIKIAIAAILALLLATTAAQAAGVRVTVENLAPNNGLSITPVWVGFHYGTFDTFDAGSLASADLERLAEDGNPGPISGSFTGVSDGVIFGPGAPPVYHPGESASDVFNLNPASDLYFSFLSMAIPSNDAFIGNDDPLAYQISSGGSFQDQTIDIFGSMLWDAGTEFNDEIPANTPLLGQAVPDTGVPTLDPIALHGGFIPGGNILTAFPNADFTAPGYQIARIKVEAIPAPGSLMLAALGIGFLSRKRLLKNT